MRSIARTLAAVLVVSLSIALPASAAGDWPWPLAGPVLTPFRNGDDPYAAGQHRGIDIAGEEGEAVVSSTPGTVTFAGLAGASGLTVGIRTADGRFELSYLHLSSIAVRAGQSVVPGERLGAVGVTGTRSLDEAHLHFGVREAGTDHAYLDPLAFLSESAAVAPLPDGAPVPVPAPAAITPEREGSPAPARVGAAVPGRARARASAPANRATTSAPAAPVRPRAQRSAGRPTTAPVRSAATRAARAQPRAAERPAPGGARSVDATSRTRLGSGPSGRRASSRPKAEVESSARAAGPAVPAGPVAVGPAAEGGASTGWWAACLGVGLLALLGHAVRGRREASAEALPSPRGGDAEPASGAAASGPSGPRPRGPEHARREALRRRPGAPAASSIDPACPTSSRRRSTTSTPSLISATRTRRSRPTSSPATCDSEERMSSS